MGNEYVQTVASAIVEQLKEGTAPWVKPWQPGERFMPYNPSSGKDYHGMNAMWLLSVAQKHGYDDARWMTYKQAQGQDAQVRKGEKGTLIQYWKWEGLEPLTNAEGKPVLDENGKQVKGLVRYASPRVWSASVFNAGQIDNLPPAPDRPKLSEWERHEQAEKILAASEASIIYMPGDRAFYSPGKDSITLPERGQFPTVDGFYATALHELGHWTGHSSRLNRDLSHPFGSEGYAKEELRAEIASLMMGEQLEIGHDPSQHVAYIASWIRALEEDPREIFRAASDAEKITKFIRGLEQTQEQTQEEILQVQVPVIREETMAMKTTPERVYLNVPYVEKEEAKGYGAKWDKAAKQWYAPSGVNLEPLERWMPGNNLEMTLAPREEFAAALRDAGLILDGEPEMNGELRRVRVEGDKPGEKSGAYVGFWDGHPAGYIQNFKTGLQSNWKSKNRSQLIGVEDRAKLDAEAAERRLEREKQLDEKYAQTAQEAEALLSLAVPVTEHPYLSQKTVSSYGLRRDAEGNLMIPVQDMDGKVWSFQTISPEGRKSFLKDGKTHGGHYLIGDPDQADTVLIAEGYATAATLHEMTGKPVAVAFNSGNLSAVAEAFRERYPEKVLYIAGDNDHQKEQTGKHNVGREKAEEAAERVDGYLLLPFFEMDDPGTDWNDLVQSKGLEGTRHQVQAGLAIGERKQLAKTLMNEQVQEKEPQHQEQTQEKELVNTGGRQR